MARMGIRRGAVLAAVLIALVATVGGCGDDDSGASPAPTPTATPVAPTPPPNIVFIILDDVGIDQLETFGLGQGNLGSTPNLNALAHTGVRFSNTWSMPECSPSRATIFTGRYPLRHGVTSALIPNMLPQAQVSPYEATLPRLLAQAGYTSAMVGKYHLGNRNPAGNCSPQTTGFDFFDGNMEAGPPSIDRQAGHVEDGAAADMPCGFAPADFTGNCYFADGSCRPDVVDVPDSHGGSESAPVSGRNCMEAGGIFVRQGGDCRTTDPTACPDSTHSACLALDDGSAILDFDRPNGYYAWPQTTLSGTLDPGTTEFPNPQCGEPPIGRTYMTIAQTSDSIDWYLQQTGPRMLTVSYNSIHTPYQQAPRSLAALPAANELVCGDVPSDRILGDNMLESMDSEIGRLLSSLGLAALDDDGVIRTEVDADGYAQIPELKATNTLVVVVGDNGTFFEVVKLPLDPLRSKGTVYETGVWVPLIIAGAPVQGPTGREVSALVNIADLFRLFAEVGGVDVASAVPAAHTLDAQPLLPYLTNPAQPAIRQFNFTELGPGAFEQPPNPDTRSWPCVLTIAGNNACNEVLFDTQDFCNTNSGVWWGPTDNPEPEVVAIVGEDQARQGTSSCCQVNAAYLAAGESPVILSPLEQFAVRNDAYKLVHLSLPDCSMEDGSVPPANRREVLEFYDLTDPTALNPLSLDAGPANLVCHSRSAGAPATCRDGSQCDDSNPASCLNDGPLTNFNALQAELDRVLDSQSACPGDGNLDMRVDQRDADGVTAFAAAMSPLTGDIGGPSFFDLNGDARTDDADAAIVAAHMGTDCLGPCRRSDLNRDGYVDDADAALLEEASGPCDLCGADLNGDGVVDGEDASILDGERGCSMPTPTPTPVPTKQVPPRTVTPIEICDEVCIPDAVGRQCGCPLFDDNTALPPNSDIDCDLVCDEYATCQQNQVELGYTCDATLCTSRQISLVAEGCLGIQQCDLSETLRAELAAGCSCCASQLCGCEASALTDEAVRLLDERQREAGETPQCDINGTLCGVP